MHEDWAACFMYIVVLKYDAFWAVCICHFYGIMVMFVHNTRALYYIHVHIEWMEKGQIILCIVVHVCYRVQIHSSSKEAQNEFANFFWSPSVSHPDTGSSWFCKMVKLLLGQFCKFNLTLGRVEWPWDSKENQHIHFVLFFFFDDDENIHIEF